MAEGEIGLETGLVAEGTLQVVTMRRLEGALACVRRELDTHGFWTERLADVEVCLVPVGLAYGWHVEHEPGVICIPAVSACRLGDLFYGRRTSLRDVLRHEHGHALAHCHRGLFRSRRFTSPGEVCRIPAQAVQGGLDLERCVRRAPTASGAALNRLGTRRARFDGDGSSDRREPRWRLLWARHSAAWLLARAAHP